MSRKECARTEVFLEPKKWNLKKCPFVFCMHEASRQTGLIGVGPQVAMPTSGNCIVNAINAAPRLFEMQKEL